jgi:hypothetical protein
MPEDEVEAAWRATAVYQTIHHALNYQVMGSTLSPFRPLSPSESLLPDRAVLLNAMSARLSGWSEADVDRYVNEVLAENEMLKKWEGRLQGDEARLIESLQSLARKDLDTLRLTDQVKNENILAPRVSSMEDVETYGHGDIDMTD